MLIRMNGNGWTLVDGSRQMDRIGQIVVDECQMEVDECWMEL